MSAAGGVAGLLGGLALCLVLARLPMMRRINLADRLDPYLVETSIRSISAGAQQGNANPVLTIVGPWIESIADRLDRLLGGRASIERRLMQAGRPVNVAAFRAEQVTWASVGLAVGVILTVVRTAGGPGPNPAGCFALTMFLCGGGAMARDTWLTREVTARERGLIAELPVMAELLALAVTAGDGPIGALERVTKRSTGPLSQELRLALAQARAGATLVEALGGIAQRTGMAPLARFVDGMVVSIERGTPLAEVLRSQAHDAREAAKRALLESGGKREIAMLAPVVFLVLPVVILFAIYPGFIQFTVVTS